MLIGGRTTSWQSMVINSSCWQSARRRIEAHQGTLVLAAAPRMSSTRCLRSPPPTLLCRAATRCSGTVINTPAGNFSTLPMPVKSCRIKNYTQFKQQQCKHILTAMLPVGTD